MEFNRVLIKKQACRRESIISIEARCQVTRMPLLYFNRGTEYAYLHGATHCSLMPLNSHHVKRYLYAIGMYIQTHNQSVQT